MKKIAMILTLILSSVSILTAQSTGPDMAVATVRLERTEPISGRQFEASVNALQAQMGRILTADERKTVLDEMIDQTLVVQAAVADREISVTDQEVQQAGLQLLSQQLQAAGAIPPGAILTDINQYRMVIENEGLTVAEYEQSIRNQLLTERYITTKQRALFESIEEPTEREINNEYQQRIQEFVVSDSVFFSHIFFSTQNLDPSLLSQKRAHAEEVHRTLINTAATFEELVRRESEDEQSKAMNGNVGQVMKGNPNMVQIFGQDFIDELFELEPGQVSPVLQSNVGYHIVMVTEQRPAGLLPVSDLEVSSYLEQIVYARKYQQAFEQAASLVVTDLRSRAQINYFGEFR